MVVKKRRTAMLALKRGEVSGSGSIMNAALILFPFSA
jgi:hypothetical protein